ncbi:MAG: hypothetical protein AAF197_08680 [Pseudomonadota bacterium]
MLTVIDAKSVLDRYINALYAGDKKRAGAFLAEDFGCHAGRNPEEHIAHELWEYATREDHFGLADGFQVKIDLFQTVTHGTDKAYRCVFSIVNANAQLVYRDVLLLDSAGFIIGDQAPFEVIGKLRFEDDVVWRVMVGHQVQQPPAKINPVGLPHDNAELLVVDQPSGMHVLEYRYCGRDDDLASQCQRFKLYPLGAAPSTLEVYMPGRDHWAFEPNRFPEISQDGKTVTLPQSEQFAWHLQVQAEAGDLHEIEMPKDNVYQFEAPIMRAILTDALDHDWVTMAAS